MAERRRLLLLLILWLPLAYSLVPIWFDSTNSLHRDLDGSTHPENPERITASLLALQRFRQEHGGIQLMDVATGTPAVIKGIEIRHEPFSDQELQHAKDMMIAAHTRDLVDNLQEFSRASRQKRIDQGKAPLVHMGYIGADTYVTNESFDVCLRATATWIRAADRAAATGRPTFCLTRPPGHHATTTGQNGFCLYNFAAATAIHALQQDPKIKVSLLDFDVHYGQGVADIVEKHERARYVSIHQTPAFPFMGESRQVMGKYKNIFTIPVEPDTSWDTGFADLYDQALESVCTRDEWEPDLVIVGAGFDALDSDVVSKTKLEVDNYGDMTRRLLQRLAEHSSKRPAVMFGLEGGYQISTTTGEGGLPEAIVATVQALSEAQ